ncbi:MAG: hypothetical protein IJ734_06355, partial [Fibrobacter sp.]|nr:hypothetical protein [Fibrobacter sp.]
QSGAEFAGEGALTHANALYFFAPELSLQHMTEAHNMALHTQSPYTKNSALTPQKKPQPCGPRFS